MSEPRLITLENQMEAVRRDVSEAQKNVAVVENTVGPLVQQMKASTEAMRDLTTKLSELVVSNGFLQGAFEDAKVISKANGKRIKTLEDDKSSRRSGDKVWDWVVRSAVSTLIPLVLLAVAYLVFGSNLTIK